MNFRTRTKLAAEQSRKAWCWRSSPASTGRKAAGFAWKIIFGLHKKATKNCALIRTISGWQDRQPLACDVINIPSPTGEELQMALYMQSTLKQLGLDVTWQEVEEGRANVVGRWIGTGGGKNLMFNGHMDTSNTGREEFLTGIGYKPQAVVKNGVIYGLGIYNMKGALVCYTHAVKALMRAGVRLKGDVIIAAVAGEIEKTQWGEFRGKEYRARCGCASHAREFMSTPHFAKGAKR